MNAEQIQIKKFCTKAGKQFAAQLTDWLQDTRLLSEAAFLLQEKFEQKGLEEFSKKSWPEPPAGLPFTPSPFTMNVFQLEERVPKLMAGLWTSRFIFLETLWEEYLQNLVLELTDINPSIFNDFCEDKFVAATVFEVFNDKAKTVDDLRNEIAIRYATGLTRLSWNEQWKKLTKLPIGLTIEKAQKESWFNDLAVYFEMRNCIIHRNGKVSNELRKVAKHYKGKPKVHIYPVQLDFYRKRFLKCLSYIEEKVEKKRAAS